MGFDGGGRGEMFGGRGVAALVVVRGTGPRAPRRARPVAEGDCIELYNV